MGDSKYLQLVRSYGKSNHLLISIIRSTSCNRGWLRLAVEIFFGFIILCSFILITKITIGSHYKNWSRPRQRCAVQTCRVTCNNVPYFGEFEREIIHATADTAANCNGVILSLNNAMFVNSSLPKHWLSAIRVVVGELEIVGGNLQNIPSDSFQTHFGGNIRVLVLEKITVSTLAADTFIGLSSLQELYIKDCEILKIRHNALQAVGNTLQVLNIKADNQWDPVNVTGSSHTKQLRIVDFSMNEFHDILGNNSFSQLKYCQVLFLNSCKITNIGVGAFDFLNSIEILHLNNNYLVSLSSDIFNMIIPREPRISIQENLLNCSCDSVLRILLKLDLFIVEPTCFYPIAFRGKKISSLEKYCDDSLDPKLLNGNLYVFGDQAISTINHQCTLDSSQENYTVLYSPLPEFKCISNKIDQRQIKYTNVAPIIDVFSTKNNWLKPTFSIGSKGFSMVSLVFSEPHDYGLLWYHSTCPKEVFCINHMPKLLRIYNEDSSIKYTFCRILLTSSLDMQQYQCVAYDLESLKLPNIYFYRTVLLTVCVAIACLLCGALSIYVVIHRNPILLKGNKRVVFVKHKTVDALILPTKISLTNNMQKDPNKTIEYSRSNNIFVISSNHIEFPEKFHRTNSTVTNESNDPSYISALQPTEDQLAEWRITRNFETTYTYDSIDSNLPTHSRFSANSLPYYSYDNTENIYDTVKE